MTFGPTYRLWDLGPSDTESLRLFSCADAGRWAAEVEHGIRNEVAAQTAIGTYGKGVFLAGELCAVSTWQVIDDIWHSSIIAVDRAHRRRGIARELKKELIRAADAAGATEVRSTVAFENDAMITLNRSLGAEIIAIGNVWGRVDYFRAVFRLR